MGSLGVLSGEETCAIMAAQGFVKNPAKGKSYSDAETAGGRDNYGAHSESQGALDRRPSRYYSPESSTSKPIRTGMSNEVVWRYGRKSPGMNPGTTQE